MKRMLITLLVLCAVFVASAEVTFNLFGDSDLYLYLDNEAGPLSYTNSGVVATFTGVGGDMNRTTSGFGINASGSGDTTFALDVNEAFDVSFDQVVQITALDFRNFESGEAINVIIGSTTNLIEFADLDNGTTDTYGGFSWEVSPKDTTVRFEVVGSTDVIAIDSITVVPEPATVAMFGVGGLIAFIIRRSALK